MSDIDALQNMTVGQLRTKHVEVFGEETGSHNKQYLLKRIAWRVQAKAQGGLASPPQLGWPDSRVTLRNVRTPSRHLKFFFAWLAANEARPSTCRERAQAFERRYREVVRAGRYADQFKV